MRNVATLLLFVFSFSSVLAQNENKTVPSIYDKIMTEVKDYTLDTSAVPNDKITKKIVELRNLRGGFNINEAITFKMQEEAKEGKTPKEQLDRLIMEYKEGIGKKWLDNAVIWIYRKHFSYSELKQLVKFYKTSAGQKMADDFPIIMIKTIKAAETITSVLVERARTNK